MALHNDIGALGERLVAEHLRDVAPVTRGAVADLRLADRIEIEVKTAIPSRPSKKQPYRTYQFCIRRDGRKGLRAPVLVCVCLDPASLDVATFVIPAQEIEASGLKKVRIPYRMGGRWAAWRDAWHVIADAVEERAGSAGWQGTEGKAA